MKPLENRTAVVTGASSGIGREIAHAYARAGARVVVADLREEPRREGFEQDSAKSTAESIVAEGGEAVFVRCDVTDFADVRGAVETAVERFGRLDIFVNNAGVLPPRKLLHEFGEEEWDLSISVNAKGTFFGIKAAVLRFLEQGGGGAIVNLVSTGGLQGNPHISVYNAAKGAAALLTKCAASEYGPENIRVNGICPTNVQTALMRETLDDDAASEAFVSSLPLRRWGKPSDIASLAVFLASDESSFIHGALIPIDGGETLGRYSL